MSYLVMECHPGYAVVLDEQGRFFKTANLNYEVGQRVEQIIPMRRDEDAAGGWKRQIRAFAAAAACLCLGLLGSWQVLAVPVGTVRMQINPDVMMWVSRMNYVTKAEGLNEDGQALVDSISVRGKKVETLSDELALRAVEMGYLKEDGHVSLTVESEKAEWKTATEELLVLELEIHLPEQVQVTVAQQPEQFPESQIPGEEQQSVEKPERPPQSGENSKGEKPGKDEKPEKPGKEEKTEQVKVITPEKARKNALKYLGLKEKDGIVGFEQELEDGVYELDFTCAGKEYEVDVDARTGEILRAEGKPADEEDPPELPEPDDSDDPDDDRDDDDDIPEPDDNEAEDNDQDDGDDDEDDDIEDDESDDDDDDGEDE